MRFFIGLIIGAAIAVAAIWYYNGSHRSRLQAAGQQIEDNSKAAANSIQDKLRSWNLRTDDIKDELAKTGQVIRRKAQDAGKAISDATADTRITAAIKGKLVADRDLSALSISVNTTAGRVTLSGTVSSPEHIGKAILLAMETEGVHDVVSTLQVK